MNLPSSVLLTRRRRIAISHVIAAFVTVAVVNVIGFKTSQGQIAERSLDGIAMPRPSGTLVEADAGLRTGRWRRSNRLNGYVGDDYLVSDNLAATIEFVTTPPWTVTALAAVTDGDGQDHEFNLRMIYPADRSFASSLPVSVTHRGVTRTRLMSLRDHGDDGFSKLIGSYKLRPGESIRVRMVAKDAGGPVCVDALWWPPSQ